jgi:hypothetical protein
MAQFIDILDATVFMLPVMLAAAYTVKFVVRFAH